MKRATGIIAAMAILGVFTACQTAKPASASRIVQVVTPGQNFIETEVAGFAPTAEFTKDTIDFSVLFANASMVKSWKVSMLNEKGVSVRNFSGSGTALPYIVTWNGKSLGGELVPEGIYTATMKVDYGKAYSDGEAYSRPFILDRTNPKGSISVSPDLFSPIVASDTMNITIKPDPSIARLDSWTLNVYDPAGYLFKSFVGKWPNNTIVWDGKGIDGDMVVSAADYPVEVELRDEFGLVDSFKDKISIDIIVIEDGENYRIEDTQVYFEAYTADYKNVPADIAAQNVVRLDRLSSKLKKFSEYKIKIVGHAVMIHWDNAALGKIEQETLLVPLSLARSEAIKDALVERGLDAKKIETSGVGSAEPIVPDSDYARRWRNRRTSIYLMK